MKRTKAIAALAICACTMAAAWAATPGDVAMKVFEGVRDYNIGQIRANCTSTAAEGFEFLAEAGKELGTAKGATASVADTQIDGNTAVVTLRISQPGQPTEDNKLHLQNAGGTWKVDDLMK